MSLVHEHWRIEGAGGVGEAGADVLGFQAGIILKDFRLDAVLISFGFAVAIGICSGLYPAWKASRIQPIEALRYG